VGQELCHPAGADADAGYQQGEETGNGGEKAGPVVPVEQPLGPVVVLAHRGASYDAPEHTFPSYDRAVKADTDFLECDLQLTKDGVLVCIHDTTVNRTTGASKTGRVDSYTLAQLRSMDFGSWFNTVNPARASKDFVGAKVVPLEEQTACYRKPHRTCASTSRPKLPASTPASSSRSW